MKKRPIVMQTAIRVSGVFFAVLLILTASFTVFITTYMRDQILESKGAALETVVGYMESDLENLVGPIISLGEYEPTVRLARGFYPMYSPSWMENIRNLGGYLNNVSMFTRYVVDINLLDGGMHSVYSMNNLLRADYDYGGQEWFQKALEREGVLKYAPPHGTDHLYQKQRVTFSIIYPIRRQGSQIGYILMEVDLMELAQFLTEKKQGDRYILLDEEGQPIYDWRSTEPKEEGEEVPSISLKSSGKSGEKEALLQGKSSYYLAREISANRWTLILDCSRRVILDPVRRLVAIVGAALVMLLVLLTLVIVDQARRMDRPMKALLGRINDYDGTGARPVAGEEDAPLEVAVISERFEVMADKVHSLIERVYLAEIRKREAELEALMNQINPHFLYNVFQLIETKAVLADNREIEDMIQALSQMMRYTMERKRDMVPIQEELAYIDHYVMFYQARFPQMFTYELDCPEELKKRLCPKFILQPVVENCMKHAFDRQEEGGVLSIWVREEPEAILLTVRDNGRGIEKERLERVQRRLLAIDHEEGIGIVNTHARIRLIYGEGYGLSIDSDGQHGTRVLLRIGKEPHFVRDPEGERVQNEHPNRVGRVDTSILEERQQDV